MNGNHNSSAPGSILVAVISGLLVFCLTTWLGELDTRSSILISISVAAILAVAYFLYVKWSEKVGKGKRLRKLKAQEALSPELNHLGRTVPQRQEQVGIHVENSSGTVVDGNVIRGVTKGIVSKNNRDFKARGNDIS